MILEPADMERALASHRGASSPTAFVVQDLILSQPDLGVDPGDALAAAMALLAAHTRELAASVLAVAREAGGDERMHSHGMKHAAQYLFGMAAGLDAAAAGKGNR